MSADQAGDFALQQLVQAAQVCPGAAAKGKYITEIGWPSAGNSNGNAVAGAPGAEDGHASYHAEGRYRGVLVLFSE